MRYVHSIVSLTIAATATTSAVELNLPGRCKLPAKPGPCRAAMQRWHFNTTSMSCGTFNFGGCRQNENNFFTESECENACEAYVPHQLKSGLSDDNTGSIKQKSAPMADGCSEEMKVVGRCRGMFEKWSWNQETLKCEMFVFGGCGENGNNYPSKKKCEKKCSYLASQRVMFFDAVENPTEEEPEEEQVDPCTEPQYMGPCRARFERFSFDSVTGECGNFTYGGCQGNGNNFRSKQLCREKCLKTTGHQQDAVVGNGEEEEGAQNDMTATTTKKPEIKQTTSVKPKSPKNVPEVDLCTLPADPGFCRGFFPSWFHNSTSGKCERFGYGGCNGNKNKFTSVEACQKRCVKDVIEEEEIEEVEPEKVEPEEQQPEEENPFFGRFLIGDLDNGSDKPLCEQPLFGGPCRGLHKKWRFDGENCVLFRYGGCQGNQNNFASESQCRKSCMMLGSALNGEGEKEEEEEEETGNGKSLIMSREAIREIKKRGRQADRKNSGKGKGKGKNGKNRNGKSKKAKNNGITNRSNNRGKVVSSEAEDEMRSNFMNNMLTF